MDVDDYERLKLPASGECVDVLLGLHLVERVLALNLGDQLILALARRDHRVVELAPLLLDVASHAGVRCGTCVE